MPQNQVTKPIPKELRCEWRKRKASDYIKRGGKNVDEQSIFSRVFGD